MPNPDVDLVASKLYEWGQLARAYPPCWDKAGISQPIRGPEGHNDQIGRMLPGRGLYLGVDLKSLGIHRPIPGVFEHTIVQRAVDKAQKIRRSARRMILDEAAAITTYDGIVNARGNGGANDILVQKNSITTVANVWSSLWQAGGMPAAGSFSSGLTNGTAPNATTAGALSLGLSLPSGANSKYLLTFGFTSSSAINMLLLADLVSQTGAVSAATASNQTVTPVALTRYTSGVGVMMTAEVTTAIGTTASNIVVTYTSQNAGGSTQATQSAAMTTSMIVSRMLPSATAPIFQLQSGDYGVESISNVKLSAAMTAGVFAMELYFPLMFLPGIVANIYIERDSTTQIDGICNLPVGSDSHLGSLIAYAQMNTTTSGTFVGTMRSVQG